MDMLNFQKMRTSEEWLEEKVSAYNENPKKALEDMLSTSIDVEFDTYINSGGSTNYPNKQRYFINLTTD